jgi:hypothetical protein
VISVAVEREVPLELFNELPSRKGPKVDHGFKGTAEFSALCSMVSMEVKEWYFHWCLSLLRKTSGFNLLAIKENDRDRARHRSA